MYCFCMVDKKFYKKPMQNVKVNIVQICYIRYYSSSVRLWFFVYYCIKYHKYHLKTCIKAQKYSQIPQKQKLHKTRIGCVCMAFQTNSLISYQIAILHQKMQILIIICVKWLKNVQKKCTHTMLKIPAIKP